MLLLTCILFGFSLTRFHSYLSEAQPHLASPSEPRTLDCAASGKKRKGLRKTEVERHTAGLNRKHLTKLKLVKYTRHLVNLEGYRGRVASLPGQLTRVLIYDPCCFSALVLSPVKTDPVLLVCLCTVHYPAIECMSKKPCCNSIYFPLEQAPTSKVASAGEFCEGRVQRWLAPSPPSRRRSSVGDTTRRLLEQKRHVGWSGSDPQSEEVKLERGSRSIRNPLTSRLANGGMQTCVGMQTLHDPC